MLTVTTPTYNRAHTLGNCYQSLLSQTCKDFIWMIIDDGSTDNTEQVVQGWIKEEKIDIRYYKKKNGGKASALNMGIALLETPYAVCLDSDDYFTDKAIEQALIELERVRNNNDICGILALRSHEDGSVLGGREIPASYDGVSAENLLIEENLRTEFICFYKTDILKSFRFPKYEGEKFVPPSWMMFAITRDYKYKVSHDRFCICEYISDGITKNKKKIIINNPHGYSCAKLWYFELSKKPKQIVKHGVMYVCGCIIAKDREWLKNTTRKVWAIGLYPFAYLVYRTRFCKTIG